MLLSEVAKAFWVVENMFLVVSQDVCGWLHGRLLMFARTWTSGC